MDGRVVLVTGGANGIGWATARRFAAAGDAVVVLDRDGAAAAARAAEMGGDASSVACDISNADAVHAAVAACLRRYGHIDVLVNNAGVIDGSGTPLVEQSVDTFRALMAVNVTGTYQMAKAVGREMLRAAGGAIVNVASCAGFVATPYRNGYGASKAAIMSLTRSLACEWAPRGVRVTGLAPGYIRTDMVEGLIASGKLDPLTVGRCIPLGRMGLPAEMAEVIFHLASDDASYLCGTTVAADGGFMAFGGSGDASKAEARVRNRPGPRSVVVAGEAQGVGLAIAGHFTARGDRVMLFDPDPVALARAKAGAGAPGLTACGAMTDAVVAAAAAQAAARAWGGIDVLIFAGASLASQPQTFADDFDTALAGAFTWAKAVGPMLLASGGSAVVVTPPADSRTGIALDAPGAAAAGLRMLTRSLACEWGPLGVRVNAVAPGIVAQPAAVGRGEEGEADDAAARATPIGRAGEASEIAAVVGFLASPAASYVNGSVFEVDGGWGALCDLRRAP